MADHGIMMTATSAVELRPMEESDLEEVVALEDAIYPQPWSRQIFVDELSAPQRVYVVAVVDDEIVGYAGLMVIAGDAHVTTVAVDPTARRLRLATRLMLEIVGRSLDLDARHLTLEVRMSNRAAQRLYSRFGLAPVGVRKDYYRDEDALIMWATDIDGDEYRERLAAIAADLEESDEAYDG